jgi:hypothetical protein
LHEKEKERTFFFPSREWIRKRLAWSTVENAPSSSLGKNIFEVPSNFNIGGKKRGIFFFHFFHHVEPKEER